jgi:putative hydrolase
VLFRSLLEGHGDVVMTRASREHVPNGERFHRVMHERRQQAKGLNKLMQRLLGIEAKLAQYELGESFIEKVESERGRQALEPVWCEAANLPTMDEIREPHLWLERVAPAAVGS